MALLCQIDELWLRSIEATIPSIVAKAGFFGGGIQLLDDRSRHFNCHVEDHNKCIKFFFGKVTQSDPTIPHWIDCQNNLILTILIFRIFENLDLSIDKVQHHLDILVEVIPITFPMIFPILRHGVRAFASVS